MVFKARDNEDFKQALKYYFLESQVLPFGAGGSTTPDQVGRYTDLTRSTIGSWDTSNVTDMSFAFDCAQTSQSGRADFNEDISGWDTSNVTTFYAMFQQQRYFNKLIGAWDTSNATNFNYMFYGAQAFDQDLSKWNTSSARSMAQMFQGAVAFNSPIATWDVSNVTDFSQMFFVASLFNQDIRVWDVSKGVHFQFMFAHATAFSYDLQMWRVDANANVINMFLSATVLHTLYVGSPTFGDTPDLSFFNKQPTAIYTVYGFDMGFKTQTMGQSDLAMARATFRKVQPAKANSKQYKTQNSSHDSFARRVALTSRAAKSSVSMNGVLPVFTSSDSNFILSRLRLARG